MKQQSKKVYELGVPVLVELWTENLVGGTGYFGYMIRSATDYDKPNTGFPSDRAWSQMPWGPIDEVKEVSGG